MWYARKLEFTRHVRRPTSAVRLEELIPRRGIEARDRDVTSPTISLEETRCSSGRVIPETRIRKFDQALKQDKGVDPIMSFTTRCTGTCKRFHTISQVCNRSERRSLAQKWCASLRNIKVHRLPRAGSSIT